MIVVTGGDRDSSYGGLFTGHVELEMLHAASNDQEPDTALVHFHSGAVTNWHHHPGGQLLFVVSGEARVGTSADGAVTINPGHLVVAPLQRGLALLTRPREMGRCAQRMLPVRPSAVD